ncbi:SDR family oxidoreductase [Plastoroseomonas arctica]|uniref:DUF4166 domain-containing protein n=1 Tax=Plastoroseomonas arctica TaxID=1509237 RepID=A0AAF1K6W3_9PROT|nr:SDR family oxidoreductase [Plastoroseomonas arctica]MBR0657483.1 DUF4166 domain-containing protein [Plastoroseomonas arctica]
MKILILGGYGVFGGRLAALLADIADLELLICGRNLRRAEAFCARLPLRATLRPFALDRSDIAHGLAALAPALVVDASGPFQDYGADCYPVVEACIAAGVDYLDFADAADFVFGVSRFDEAAKRMGVFVLSGVSSFPVLTAAVLREMAKSMDIVGVEGGIAPSPHAGIGLNVMRAVVGYAGAPVTLRRCGVPAQGIGLAESMRYTVAVPGRLPLRNLRFSLVDVPDLRVIPPEHPTLTDIWMGAGPVPETLHRALNLLAILRARWRLPSYAPLARLFYAVLNLTKFGEHRGGMFVRARGMRDGQTREMSWHLLAEGDDGPLIPSMAIEAIIRKLRAGERPPPGARPATQALALSDYDALFADRAIVTGIRSDAPEAPLYRRVLGPAFDALPPRVQELHGRIAARAWRGRAQVLRGRGWLARLVASLLGFPPAAEDVPLTVTLTPEDGRERWTRDFGGKRFESVQACGAARDQHLIVERFGRIAVSLALVLEGEQLFLVPRRWSLFGIPMPHSLLPAGRSHETELDGRFVFDVEIAAPLVGLVIAYRGSLDPVPATAA